MRPEKRKAMSEKLRIISVQPQYLKNVYRVELLHGLWPTDREILEFCDFPLTAPFSGKIEEMANFAIVTVYTD